MINNINTFEFREKFATLLSKLYYSASLSLEQISYKIAYTNAFSFIENNDVQWFMNKPYNELAKELFNAVLIHESYDVNPVYWAGIQYLNIMIHKRIPLRQIFILCPLKDMVSHYHIYHEMSENQLIDEFMENEYKRSLLSILIKKNNTTFTKVATLTGININTLKRYSRSNDMLYKALFNNIVLLMKALEINDVSVFMKESSFASMNSIYLNNDNKNKLIVLLKEYLNIDGNLELFDRDCTKEDKDGIYIGAINTIKYKGVIKTITDSDLLSLIKRAI